MLLETIATMEPFGLQPLCQYDDSMDALPSLWETGEFGSPMTGDLRGDGNLQQFECLNFMSDKDGEDEDHLAVDAEPLVILRDRLITDASMVDLLPGSYANNKNIKESPLLGSASSAPFNVYVTTESPSSLEINDDIKLNQEMAGDFCDPLTLNIKSENVDVNDVYVPAAAVAVRPGDKRKRNAIARVRDVAKMKAIAADCGDGLTRMSISFTNNNNNNNSGRFILPPTPPSSTSSDSEGSVSPLRDAVSPKLEPEEMVVIDVNRRIAANNSVLLAKTSINNSSCNNNNNNITGDSFTSVSNRHPINSPLISYQPKGSTGTLQLTEEEKRTLLAEGYPVPTRLPLTKAEEKSLKKIRRKIKNKISAQESRRKKKEYMDTLERRATILADENHDYRQRLHQLEADNMSLQLQLNRFHELLNQSDIQLHVNDESPSNSLVKNDTSEGGSGGCGP